MAWWRFWGKSPDTGVIQNTGEVYNYRMFDTYNDFYANNSALRSVVDTIASSLSSVPLKFYDTHKHKQFTLAEVCTDDYGFMHEVTTSLLRGHNVTVGIANSVIEVAKHDKPYDELVTLSGAPWAGKIEALANELREAQSASEYRAQVWARAGRFGGWFERPVGAPNLNEEGRDRLTKSLHAFQNNNGRAGETPIFEEGMTYHTGTISAKETEWKESQELLLQHVCNVYNLPVAILTGGASERDRAYFYGDTMSGLARVIVSGLKRLFHGAYIPRFNFDSKLSGSFLERAKILSTLAGRPVLDLDEARAIIDYAPYTGDNMVTPLNVLTGGKTSPQDGDNILPIYETVKQLGQGE